MLKTGRQFSRKRIGPPQRCVNFVSRSAGCRLRIAPFDRLQTDSARSPAAMSIRLRSRESAASTRPAPQDYASVAHARGPTDTANRPCRRVFLPRGRWPRALFCKGAVRTASVSLGSAHPARAREIERKRIRGEEDFRAAEHRRAACVEPQRERHFRAHAAIRSCDRVIFDDRSSAFVCAARARPADELSRIERSARNFFTTRSVAGIVPIDRRILDALAAADFPCAGQREIAIDVEFGENAFEAGEDISEAGKFARGGFREDHAAGSAAGACADPPRFEDRDGFFRSETAQPRSRGQARETAADDGEIDGCRNGLRRTAKSICQGERPRRMRRSNENQAAALNVFRSGHRREDGPKAQIDSVRGRNRTELQDSARIRLQARRGRN